MTIINDQDLKQALSVLSIAEQRVIASQFIANILHLNPDVMIEKALKLLQERQYTEAELSSVYRSVKSLSVKTYTACGDDANWIAQAAHFVALACKTCLMPLPQLNKTISLAWKCAMQVRMARNCEMIENDSQTDADEAQKQYDVINQFLS